MICFNLQQDPALLFSLSADEARRRLYAKSSELAGNESRPALKLVHLNKCPILAPAKTLSAERAEQLGIDRTQCLQHLEQLRQQRELMLRLVHDIYQAESTSEPSQCPDYSLYQGFISDQDRRLLPQIHQLSPQQPGCGTAGISG